MLFLIIAEKINTGYVFLQCHYLHTRMNHKKVFYCLNESDFDFKHFIEYENKEDDIYPCTRP